VASPVAWEHHYGVLLPILAVVAPAAIARRIWGTITPIYLGLVLLLVSQRLDEITNLVATTYLNVMQSHVFIGALIILAVTYQLTFRPVERESSGRMA
jgi:alpha-1,2-mannosyltransferase